MQRHVVPDPVFVGTKGLTGQSILNGVPMFVTDQLDGPLEIGARFVQLPHIEIAMSPMSKQSEGVRVGAKPAGVGINRALKAAYLDIKITEGDIGFLGLRHLRFQASDSFVDFGPLLDRDVVAVKRCAAEGGCFDDTRRSLFCLRHHSGETEQQGREPAVRMSHGVFPFRYSKG